MKSAIPDPQTFVLYFGVEILILTENTVWHAFMHLSLAVVTPREESYILPPGCPWRARITQQSCIIFVSFCPWRSAQFMSSKYQPGDSLFKDIVIQLKNQGKIFILQMRLLVQKYGS